MTKKSEVEQKFCGNCGSHNAYNFPEEIFCTRRFLENKNPVVKTLWHCEDWHLNSQKCQCVEDVTKHEKR